MAWTSGMTEVMREDWPLELAHAAARSGAPNARHARAIWAGV